SARTYRASIEQYPCCPTATPSSTGWAALVHRRLVALRRNRRATGGYRFAHGPGYGPLLFPLQDRHPHRARRHLANHHPRLLARQTRHRGVKSRRAPYMAAITASAARAVGEADDLAACAHAGIIAR